MLKKLRGLLTSLSSYLNDVFSGETVRQIDQYLGGSSNDKAKKKSLEFDNYLEVEETFDEFFSNTEYVSQVLKSIDPPTK